MSKRIIITQGQLQMVFTEQQVEIATAVVCPVCHQTITEARPCPHTLGTTTHMFDQALLFHTKQERRRKVAGSR